MAEELSWDALDESILKSNSRDEPLSELEQKDLERMLENAQISVPKPQEGSDQSYMSQDNEPSQPYDQLESDWGGNALGPDKEQDSEIARMYNLGDSREEENEPRRWNPMTLFYE